ncbi:MAG TPA: methyltransferase domain-containing protein [Solirubrobacteraceae bacterium]|jgi:SAM-dependent methyltransferase
MRDRAALSVAGCRAAYDAHAADYARVLDPTLAGVVERLADLVDVRRGIRLLDLATGTGAVARAAAARGASVVGVDISAPMLAVARRLSPGIDIRRADVHALPFADEEFDVVTCGLALSHFHEPHRALGEALRVLRMGGRLAASTWGTGGGTPSSGAVVELLKRYGAHETGYTLDEETWLHPEQGSAVLRRAGFSDVSATTEKFTGTFVDAARALQWTLAWPCGSARLARLEPSKRDAFLAEARQALTRADLSWNLVFNFYLATKATRR